MTEYSPGTARPSSGPTTDGPTTDGPSVEGPSVEGPATGGQSAAALLSDRLPALTGLRAVASLAVVVTHAAFWTGRYGTDTLGLIWARFDFGVALFFALSGLLLSRPWIAAARNRSAAPSTGRYLRNRVLRILPAYWIAVLLAVLFVPTTTGRGAEGVIRQLTFTQIYGADQLREGLTQTWSLAVEALFYLLLPLIGWGILRLVCRDRWRPGLVLAALSGLVAVNIGYHVLIYAVPEITVTSRMWLPGYLSWFAVGIALLVLATAAADGVPWARPLMRVVEESPWAVIATGIVLLGIAATPLAGAASLYQDTAGAAITRNLLYAAAAGLLMAPLLDQASSPARALSVRPVRWVGLISYELFLLHVMLLELVMVMLGYETFTGSMVVVLTLTLAVSLPASWLLYRLVEVPLRRLGRGQGETATASPAATRSWTSASDPA